MDADEVDGEIPVFGVHETVSVLKEVEKSQTDSGMDDGSNIGSSGHVDNSDDDDDDDEIVLRKPKKSLHRILDDDESDMSQDVPSKKETKTVSSKKEGMTPEEVLEAVMNAPDSSEDSDSETSQESPRAKRKKLKRPVPDDSSDEDVPLMDSIKKNMEGAEGLFDAEEESDGEGRKRPENLFDSDKDSSECQSSGSEVERSDTEAGQDEGFDDVDPKLLAKLRKGAAKQERKKSARQAKQEELTSLHSETQRMVRESRVNIPYHQPAPKSLNDFLARASKKQQEYKALKGAREQRKVKVVEEVLQKARIQAAAKSQDEADKYSDSDEDWKPEDQDKKALKERIDDKLNPKPNDSKVSENEPSDILSQTKENNSLKESMNIDGDDDDSLPDLNVESSKCLEDVEKESEGVDASEELKNIRTDLESCPDGTKHENTQGSEEKSKEETKVDDDMMFEWEMGEKSEKVRYVEQDKDLPVNDGIDKEFDKSEENKENVDPKFSLNDSLSEKAVTNQSMVEKISPKNCARRQKIAALAGIDLDSIQPNLGGTAESFISFGEEEEVPMHPGVKNLMDRLSVHKKKIKRKKHDMNISIISKATVGPDQEELKLNTFTYHQEDEDSNPLLKHEAPGAKLTALKEQLQTKMKARREEARQKRQEVYALDNEEAGLEEEEAEMSEGSDTDQESEGEGGEQEEEEGEQEEEEEGEQEEEGGEQEEELYGEEEDGEKNELADTEAAEDDEEEEEGEEEEDDDEGEAGDDEDDEDELNLKLEDSDTESGKLTKLLQKNVTQNDEQETEVKKTVTSAEKASMFKEPKEPVIPEKPFSMFGSKGKENSLENSQFQSGQRLPTVSLPLPIEDSQDLCGTQQHHDMQGAGHSQQSQDFSILLEDSQSNFLDADGYLKTKSTDKKKSLATSFGALQATQGGMDELVGLCSGRFMDSQAGAREKLSRKSLFEEPVVPSTQGNMEELMGLCSGMFVDGSAGRSSHRETQSKKRKAVDTESDEESVGVYSDTEDRQDDGSDDNEENEEEEGDTDQLDSDEDEEVEKPKPRFKGFKEKSKHGKIRREFVDQEAELSGSEFDSDENDDLAEEDDIMEVEEGDRDLEGVDREKLRDEVNRIAMKQMIDEDKRELLRYQEMYLPDGDLYSEGGGRQRRFRWNNLDDESQQDMFNDGSDNEVEHEETDDFAWRKERFEREKFLKEQQSPGIGHDRDRTMLSLLDSRSTSDHMATPVSRSLPDGIGQGHRPMPDHFASAIRSLSGDNTGHDMTGTSPGTLITDH
ncbi:hypothetical protein DPMN_087341 [Dreissena polymorpha]|uniref:Claspin n=1 Tax=Dreissena polymorpha TaxID=45954 RepID=A0A9D4QVE5_DREPO|nr:hypothetical protein DPMN_087341 [Dreissena polymorpha]